MVGKNINVKQAGCMVLLKLRVVKAAFGDLMSTINCLQHS
jgi:hypothetical protein